MSVSTYTPPSDRIIHYTTVDLGERWRLGTPVHLMQYDKSLPIIAVELYSGGDPYRIPANAEMNVRVGKRDGTKVYNPILGCNAGRTIAYVEVTRQISSVYGATFASLEVIIGSNVAGSSYILLDIAKNPAQDDAIDSSDEYKILTDIVNDAQQALAKAPVIQNGTWFIWDSDKKKYVDTGHSASGTPGPAGTGIDNIVLNSDYTLTITYGNTKYTTIPIRGAAGAKGDTGSPGPTGIGIDTVTFNDDYSLTVLFTDGSSYTTPSLRGETGAAGKSFKILGYYQTITALQSGVSSPSSGDAYGVGVNEPYDIYIWDGLNHKWVNNGALQGAAGQAGTTFTPSVSSDGVLSWTNDGNRPNPPSVSIRGPAGADGKDPEPFYVNCTVSGPNIYDEDVTHDKTFDEIFAAYQAGRPCYAVLNLSNAEKYLLPLTNILATEEAKATFSMTQMMMGDTPEELDVYYVTIAPSWAEGFWGYRYTSGPKDQSLPWVAGSDNGKFLRVVNGAWAAVSISNANGGSF